MQFTSRSAKILLSLCWLLFAISCAKEDDTMIDNGILEVDVEIITPDGSAVVEVGEPFPIEATFTPYGDDTKAGNIDIRFLNPDNGDDLRTVMSDNIIEDGVYHLSTAATVLQKGPAYLSVCSYLFETITQGHYSFGVFERDCDQRYLFVQDKVGTDFQVKTNLESPNAYSVYSLNEDVVIWYNYAIRKGDAGILTIDILDEDQQLLTTILETEITGSDSQSMTYQFTEVGDYFVRLKAALPDGSSENYWITRIEVE